MAPKVDTIPAWNWDAPAAQPIEKPLVPGEGSANDEASPPAPPLSGTPDAFVNTPTPKLGTMLGSLPDVGQQVPAAAVIPSSGSPATLAAQLHAVFDKKQAALQVPRAEVKTSLPVAALTKVGASQAGEVFHLDAASVATMEVRAKQVVSQSFGPATELSLRLTPPASKQLAVRLALNQVSGAEKVPFGIEKGELKDGATVLGGPSDAYYPTLNQPQPSGSWEIVPVRGWRIEEPGKYAVDFVPASHMPQAYRDRMRVRVFGASDEERKANLEAAAQRLGMPEIAADADPLQSERFLRLSVLRMVAPAKAEELGTKLGTVSLEELDSALQAAGVDQARLEKIRVKEVFPGHMAAVDPALGEAYDKLGVKCVMVGVKSPDSAVRVLTSDGLMSTSERYSRGLHRPGASMSADEASGGAEFAFTRLIADGAAKQKVSINSSFGAGVVQLISVGEPMKEQLSRTDWHAHPSDSFGITVSNAQLAADPSDLVAKTQYDSKTGKYSDRPVLAGLVEAVNNRYGKFAPDNEACFKAGISAKAWTHAVVASETTKQDLISQLNAAGVTTLGGKALSEAIIVASNWGDVGQKLGF